MNCDKKIVGEKNEKDNNTYNPSYVCLIVNS